MSKSSWGKLSLFCWLAWIVCMILSWIFSCPAIVYVLGALGWMVGLISLIIFFCKKEKVIIEKVDKKQSINREKSM